MTDITGKYLEISDFFNAYVDWIAEIFPEIPNSHPMKCSEAEKLIVYEFSIFKSPALEGDIFEISNGRYVPAYYVDFLLSYSYRTLEVPLFSFPSTHPNDELNEIKCNIDRYIEFGLIPFAYNKNGTGFYCIDLIQGEAVVFYKNAERPSLQVRNKKLASSFLSLLIFLKEYLDWGGNISGLDDHDKTEALGELKSIDPTIGLAWEEWWLPRLLINE